MQTSDLMDKIVSLAKRRGFIFPGSEIYGGLANSWDYGPLGVELKNNLRDWWWKRFVQQRDDMVGLDAAIMMNPKVWEASGHLKNFTDPLVECKKCHYRYRADQLPEKCEQCGGKEFTGAKQFNLMFRTNVGPVDPLNELARAYLKLNWNQLKKVSENEKPTLGEIAEDLRKAFCEFDKSAVYLRPEIAQAMFVNFKNILDTSRKRLPFGIAAYGKAFRNEITPGNFIFRTLEFDLMEFEFFIPENEWEKWFEYWLGEQQAWLSDMGFDPRNLRLREHGEDERAHYSKRTVDIEYHTPFGWKELFGLAYRTDYDLKNHMQKSGADLQYTDTETKEKFIPHVIEPTFGLTRLLLMTLLEAYKQEEERIVLKLYPKLAPYKAAVFPLLKNKPELVAAARKIYDELRKEFMVAWDERGNIGKRYFSQDEIGTPYCITVDFQTLDDQTITVRDRDTMKQERVHIADVKDYIQKKIV